MVLHQGLYEAHLPVTDLEASIAFYTGSLGFEMGQAAPDGASALLTLEAEGRGWLLGLFEVPEVRHRHPAEHHLAFRVPSEEVEMMVPWLVEAGIEPRHPPGSEVQGPMEEPIVHGWMPAASVFFRDPDDHLLELIAELPGPPDHEAVYEPWSKWKARQR